MNFEVGDRVEIIESNVPTIPLKWVGVAGYITKRTLDGMYIFKGDKDSNFGCVLYGHNLAKVQIEEIKKPKFKVGEKVKIKNYRNAHWNPNGLMDKWMNKIVTIKSYDGADYGIEEDYNDRAYGGWYWREDDFESVTPLMNSATQNSINRIIDVKRYYDTKNVNQEEENDMKTEKIIELAEKREIISLGENRDEQNEALYTTDDKVMKIKQHMDKLIELLGDSSPFSGHFDPFRYATDETHEAVYEVTSRYKDQINNIKKKYNEIRTMVSACTEYEDEMGILLSYKIVERDDCSNGYRLAIQ